MSTVAGRNALRRCLAPAVLALTTFYTATLLTLVAWAFLPTVFGWTPLAITSGSMMPNIRVGDIVVVDPYDGQELQPGRVVTFEQGGRLITHRVTDVEEDTYTTKGDANAEPDSTPLVGGNIVGTGRILVPLLARPLVWVQHGRTAPAAAWGIITLVAVTIAIVRPGVRESPDDYPRRAPRGEKRAEQGGRWEPAPIDVLSQLAAADAGSASQALWHARQLPRQEADRRVPRRRVRLVAAATLLLLLAAPLAIGQTASSFAAVSTTEPHWTSHLLAPPTDITASAVCQGGLPSVDLTWTTAAHADGYDVYRAAAENGPWEKQQHLDGGDTDVWRDDAVTEGSYWYRIETRASSWVSTPSSGAGVTLVPC